MSRKYANPPIIEAVCEFRVSKNTPWDLTIPGLFYEKVNSSFPVKEQRVIQEVEFQQGPEGVQYYIRSSERIFLFAQDRKSFVQLGPRLVAVHCLAPYPTWEGFRPKIENAWNGIREVVEVNSLDRIGLRYINRIALPATAFRLEDYFGFYPFLAKNLPQEIGSFAMTVEFVYPERPDRCRVRLSTGEDPQVSSVVLDIDYFLASPGGVTCGQALQWIDQAHMQVEAIFEGCITDRLRNTFGELK